MNVALISILTLYHIVHTGWQKKQPKVDMFWVQFYVIFLIWAFLFESIENIVNIDTKWKYWKSITEIDFTFRQYVWLYCATFSLGCGGGDEGIVTPCMYGYILEIVTLRTCIDTVSLFLFFIEIINNPFLDQFVLCKEFTMVLKK